MSDSEGLKLSDLKVVDLRNELDKRNLDRTGVKNILVERLQIALKEEGHDPETYIFKLQVTEKSTPKRRSEPLAVKEEIDIDNSPSKDTVKASTIKPIVKNESETNGLSKVDATSNSTSLRLEGVQVKIEPVEEDPEHESDQPNVTGNEQEDSINLTIGEEDELAEEGESRLKKSKDESKKEEEVGEEDISCELTGNKDAPTKDKDKEKATPLDGEGQTATEKNKDASKGTENDPKDKSTPEGAKEKTADDAEERSLWIRNLRTETPAIDLKTLFSKYGKVTRAKVVVDTRLGMVRPRCYGYVTMSTVEEADECAALQNKLKLHGHTIIIKKARNDPSNPQRVSPQKRRPVAKIEMKGREPSPKRKPVKRSHSPDKRDLKRRVVSSSNNRDSRAAKQEVKPPKKDVKQVKKEKSEAEKLLPPGIEEDELEPDDAQPPIPGTEEVFLDVKEKKEQEEISSKKERDSEHKDRSRSRGSSRKRDRDRSRGRSSTKSSSRIQLEMKKLERMVREEERRRAMERERAIYRRQNEDFLRLKKEREKLKYEREKIEREKAEILKLERERQSLERQRLMREKEELKRQQMKLQVERESKRMMAPDISSQFESRKRVRSPPHQSHSSSDRRYESSSSNRKKSPLNSETSKKRKTSSELRSAHKSCKSSNESRRMRVNKVSFRFSYQPSRSASSSSSSFRPKEEQRHVKDHSHTRYVIKEEGGDYSSKQNQMWQGSSSGSGKPYGSSNPMSNQSSWAHTSRGKASSQSDQWMRPQGMDYYSYMRSSSMGVDRTVQIMPPASNMMYHGGHMGHSAQQMQHNPNNMPVMGHGPMPHMGYGGSGMPD